MIRVTSHPHVEFVPNVYTSEGGCTIRVSNPVDPRRHVAIDLAITDLADIVRKMIDNQATAANPGEDVVPRHFTRTCLLASFIELVLPNTLHALAACDGQVQPQKVCDCSPTYVAGNGPLQPCKGDCTKPATDPKGGGQ